MSKLLTSDIIPPLKDKVKTPLAPTQNTLQVFPDITSTTTITINYSGSLTALCTAGAKGTAQLVQHGLYLGGINYNSNSEVIKLCVTIPVRRGQTLDASIVGNTSKIEYIQVIEA